MRAITISGFGAEPELSDVSQPSPGPGEILVRLQAAGYNPVDLKIADGMLKDAVDHRFPLVLGSDGAGVVEAVGPGVTRYRPGDQVYGQFQHPDRGLGSYAEYAVAAEDGPVAAMPAGMIPEQAAALPTPATTAAELVETARVDVGTVVLVVGATGGVGEFAVQLAADQGAHVIATAAPGTAAALERLGAAETVDYATGSVPEQVIAAHPDGVDAILDMVTPTSGIEALANLVRPGGTIVSTIFALNPDALAARQITAVNLANRATPERLAAIADMVDASLIRARIERQVPLDEVPAALAAARRGEARGKTVFRI
ncbi:NADP-dependent oxidoreductase [Actinomadura atramentaria]|uniref:NADP-dependent oxidoreductase n=1 Tax=Actinomadura atramentaria TaxID=1990 RepID=UPI0003797FB0|nr:NADP-dependent oxidoreductase [Actinomadura atramentaria]